MFKKIFFAVVGIALVVGALVATKLEQFRTMGEVGASMVPPPTVVTATAATTGEWELTLPSIGTLTPVQGVTMATEVAGKIQRIEFESGVTINKGDVLVQLETSTEEANLRAARASAALALSNLKRTRELRKNQTTSQSELDSAEAQYEEAQAQVQSIRTTIAKKTIRAPFSGRLGMRQVDLGEVLKEGDAITTLQSLNPIYVDFTLPQEHLPTLKLGTKLRVLADAAPGEIFGGGINAISPEIDPVTRNVRLQGTIANTAELLRSGMFVTVEVVLPEREKVLAVPLTAVLFAPFGNSVFVIKEAQGKEGENASLTLAQRFVRLGTRRGDFGAVSGGLEPGEQVVTSGVFKLRSGMSVVIDNTLAPETRLSPKPDNG
jgi:membrane fusion protein (multidrug efflux system)